MQKYQLQSKSLIQTILFFAMPNNAFSLSWLAVPYMTISHFKWLAYCLTLMCSIWISIKFMLIRNLVMSISRNVRSLDVGRLGYPKIEKNPSHQCKYHLPHSTNALFHIFELECSDEMKCISFQFQVEIRWPEALHSFHSFFFFVLFEMTFSIWMK